MHTATIITTFQVRGFALGSGGATKMLKETFGDAGCHYDAKPTVIKVLVV